MKKKLAIIFSVLILVSLGFGWLYFTNHSFGTWGDDSAGYIYLWGRMNQDKPLVYQEDLTVQALAHFEDEKLARWTTPTHHEIISPDGYLASKYPIGLSQLMFIVSEITQNDEAIYYLLPTLALLNLLLVFGICYLLFSEIKFVWRLGISVFAMITLGLSELYYSYAVAQPMREIPSMFFMLLGYFIAVIALKYIYDKDKKYSPKFALIFALAMACFAYSVNIRETSLLIILPVIPLVLGYIKKRKHLLKLTLSTVLLFVIAFIPSIWNSVEISKYKEKFKKKDISSIAITSNFDHISSFSIQNLYDNQGKFRPGRGGLFHYWKIIQQMSPSVFYIVFVFIGIFYIYKKNKYLSASLMLWVLSFLALFSLWINPYSRYIMPIYPILAILGAYGLYCFIKFILPKLLKNKHSITVVGSLIVFALLFAYYPTFAQIKEEINNQEYKFKAIAYQDLQNLKEIGNGIQDYEHECCILELPPVLIFSGNWQFGTSETLEAHTGLQSIRFPFEQKKFTFEEAQVKLFMDKMLGGYEIYFWMDSTTNADTLEFIQTNYQLEEYAKYNFTFEPEVTVYRLKQL